MKRIIALLMVAVLGISLCACGSESNGSNLNEGDATEKTTNIYDKAIATEKATIIDNNGNTVEMTCLELRDASLNEAKFNSLYRGAEITFVGTVSEINTGVYENGSSIATDIIVFEETWKVSLLSGYNEQFLSTLDIGSKVQVTSNIFDVFVCVEIRGMSSLEGYTRDSLKKTTLTLVE